MPYIDPLPRTASPDFEDVFQAMEGALGYVPNSFFTMARHPAILKSAGALMDAFWYSDVVDEPTRRLVTFSCSFFSGSHYSSAHCACGAEELGLPHEKILAIVQFETAPVYDERERAIIRLCHSAANCPSEVEAQHMEKLKSLVGVDVATFIVGLISCMAFLNRWNEMCGTILEPVPRAYAETHLKQIGWELTEK